MSAIRLLCEVFVKFVIGVVVGSGVGVLTFGYFCYQNPGLLEYHRDPPVAEVCLGVGAGLLTFAATLIILFYSPLSKVPLFNWSRAEPTGGPDEPPSQSGM